jgi:hypothetical protein
MTEGLTPGSVLQDATARLSRLEPAGVAIAVPACCTVAAVAAAADAVRQAASALPAGTRIVLAYPESVAGDPGHDDSGSPVQLIPWPLSAVSRPSLALGDGRDLFVPLQTIGGHVGARACALLGAQPEAITADAIGTLVLPILANQADLLLPSYPRHRLDGLLNTAIVYPLVRALYGQQVDGQLGVDFGLSSRMVAALVDAPRPPRSGPVWLLPEALTRGWPIGQAHLPAWLSPIEEAGDVSTALAQVLGSLFLDLEHHVTTWQKVRGSRPVPGFGYSPPPVEDRRPVDIRSMIESFQLGFRNLQEIWARVLPPATVVALGRLARTPADTFRLPDDLWARIVFDFALGHRLRTINRDHLLRAMTPLYLGWVASYALDVGDADRAGVRRRVESLSVAYETQKPYLLARWRWPDRFTP